MKTNRSLVVLCTALALADTYSNENAATDQQSARQSLQLFVDDSHLESMVGLTRKIHQPSDINVNPVIKPEHPWEHRLIVYGSVLWFPKERKFKCWY